MLDPERVIWVTGRLLAHGYHLLAENGKLGQVLIARSAN